MSLVLTQRVVGSPSGLSRAMPTCQSQSLRSGTSMPNATRGSPNGFGSTSAGVRIPKEQVLTSVQMLSAVVPSRVEGSVDIDPAIAMTGLHAGASLGTSLIGVIQNDDAGAFVSEQQLLPVWTRDTQGAAPTTSVPRREATATLVPMPPTGLTAHQTESLGTSVGDIHPGNPAATMYVPMMAVPVLGPASPLHSSAPCSPASSLNFSGPCSTVMHSSSCRVTSSSGGPGGPDTGTFALLPSPAGFSSSGACSLEHPRQLQVQLQQRQPRQQEQQQQVAHERNQTQKQKQQEQEPQEVPLDVPTPVACTPFARDLPSLATCTAANSSNSSSRRSSLRDQNSVTIKATTVVKDAAGAIDKILSRGVTALVTALRSGSPPYNTPYDSLNQAVKAIAVARQYAKETGPEDAEVTFLPFHRYDNTERPDTSRFAFLVFPVPGLDEILKTADETVLNVARGSDVHKMAGAIIAVMLDRGQAVMKAAGSDAIFVAMSAVVNARHRLVQKHGFDLMLAAAWITEDTVSTMGRESKFLRFNILKTEPAGPKGNPVPCLATCLETC